MADRSEKSIQNDILLALSAEPRVMIWRNNSGLAWIGEQLPVGTGQMVRIEPGMKVLRNARPLRASIPGAPDILGVVDGRALGVEVKSRTGKQRDEQIAFQRNWERCGGLYGMPRSVDEALAILRRG